MNMIGTYARQVLKHPGAFALRVL
ncbi:MAG: hypothetical protein JWQ00_2040, partial [Noviherbaspirillum sp.]|nr:hypothetical protein [Noviherbaspirillum sp.]